MSYIRSDSALYKLLLTGKHYSLPKGQVVSAFEDNTLYLIQSGYIKRYLINTEGELGIQVIYGPGDIFPLTPVYKEAFAMDIYSGPEDYYYEAMTKLEIFAMSQTDVQKAVDANPVIYKDLFYAAGQRLNSYIHRMESLYTKGAQLKIAHQLVYLAQSFGVDTPEGIALELPLTHKDLGDVLGVARETVTRQMNDLVNLGILKPGRALVIKDMAQLKQLANWD